MTTRDKNISYDHLTHPFPDWPLAGCDRESKDSEFPANSVRRLHNYDFYGYWLCAQRRGTILKERFIKRISLAGAAQEEAQVGDIRNFKAGDGSRRVYFAAGKRLYAKSGDFAAVPIKEDVGEGGRVRSMVARNLTWYCDGVGYPFVVSHEKFKGGQYSRLTGFDAPDITHTRAVPKAGGSLVAEKAYQYMIYQAIYDKYSQSLSPWGETVSGLTYIRGELTASRKAILLENLPVPDPVSPINYLLIYRTAPLEKGIKDGTYYFWRAISDKDKEWEKRSVLDNGSIPVDLTNTLVTGNVRPPKGANFALDNGMGQMFYFKGCDAYYSKTGEPESVPYVMTVDKSNGGDIVAAAVIDNGNVLIWKERGIYIAGRFADGEMFDYRPVNMGIGCAGPLLQCVTRFGPAWMGDDREVYVWTGNGAEPLLNVNKKSFRSVFAKVSETYLKNGCMVYNKYENRLYIAFLDPTIPRELWNATTEAWEYYSSTVNNCVCYFDFTYQRWVWPWTIGAACMEIVDGFETGPKIWFGSSEDGCAYEMGYGNVDKYCPGLPGVYAPWVNPPLAMYSMTDARILVPRGTAAGAWTYQFRTTSSVMGSVVDNANIYVPGATWVAGGLIVTLRRGTATPNIKRRDKVRVTHSGGITDIYFPAYNAPAPLTLYVGYDGSTYYDSALTQVACYNPRVAHSGTWLPDQPDNLFSWDAREGLQIYSEIESGPVHMNLGHTPYANDAWLMKQLGNLYMQVAPQPENEFIIEVYNENGVLLDSFQPVFTQSGGWDRENWNVMTFDVQIAESISRPWSGACQAQGFIYKIKYPKTRGVMIGGTPRIRHINQEFWNLFGQVATATVDVRE